MELIQLNISAIRQSDAQNNAYVMLLNETVGKRQLPVVIGWCEARAIAVALDSKEKTERPLTHDLFKNFAQVVDGNVIRLFSRLYNLKEAIEPLNTLIERSFVNDFDFKNVKRFYHVSNHLRLHVCLRGVIIHHMRE